MRSSTGSRSLRACSGSVGEQLHRALQVGEEYRDLLPLTFQRGLGREDLLGEVLGSVRLWGAELPLCDGWRGA